MLEAIDRKNNNQRGSGLADKFLYKTKAITKAMPHSKEAALENRQKMLSMFTHLGLPSILLTITVEDGHNFRTRVYYGKIDEDNQLPPRDLNDDDSVIEFCIKSHPHTPNHPTRSQG